MTLLKYFILVQKLQREINVEKQRLQELKSHLETEKQQNENLLRKIREQTKTVSNMQLERDLLRRKHSFHEDKLQKFMYVFVNIFFNFYFRFI